MTDLMKVAAEVDALLTRKRWSYCFIGGIAVQKWGEARVTEDIDLTVFTDAGGEEKYIDALLKCFSPRIADARRFALENRVLLLRTDEGIELDISCGAFAFEKSVVARAKKVPVSAGVRLKLCTAEDLIVYKAFASRAIDWQDIEGIIAKQTAAKLDIKYIFEQLEPLAALKEEPEILQKLRTLIREVS